HSSRGRRSPGPHSADSSHPRHTGTLAPFRGADTRALTGAQTRERRVGGTRSPLPANGLLRGGADNYRNRRAIAAPFSAAALSAVDKTSCECECFYICERERPCVLNSAARVTPERADLK